MTSTQLARDAAAIIRSLMREMGICDHILARENSYVRTEKVLSDLDALSSHPAQDEERVERGITADELEADCKAPWQG